MSNSLSTSRKNPNFWAVTPQPWHSRYNNSHVWSPYLFHHWCHLGCANLLRFWGAGVWEGMAAKAELTESLFWDWNIECCFKEIWKQPVSEFLTTCFFILFSANVTRYLRLGNYLINCLVIYLFWDNLTSNSLSLCLSPSPEIIAVHHHTPWK